MLPSALRRDRLLTYLVWTKDVTFQPFWTNDTVADDIAATREIAGLKKDLTSMMSRRYLEKESINEKRQNTKPP
jgi:hypothetical protein